MEANSHDELMSAEAGEAAIAAGRVQGTGGRKRKTRDVTKLTGKPERSVNPLLRKERSGFVDVQRLQSPTVAVCPASRFQRELRELRRRQTAAEAVSGLKPGLEIFGFTKGQFSLLELLQAVLDITGPADVVLSTWTAARREIQVLDEMAKAGTLRSMRWLVDYTFARRDPGAAYMIRKTFGPEAIRVAQNHAKFAVFRNDGWQVVLRTSMNLNMNPRFEDFTLAHDPELAGFLTRITDEIWSRQSRMMAHGKAGEVRKHFLNDL